MRVDPKIVFLAIALAGAAKAQTANGEANVTQYGAGFFSDKIPQTALDMVNLLPGFTFSSGDSSVRGYSGAAGNVLIDGARSSDKQYTLSGVLSHIPADQVDHIEVIRGGRPGLDMLGQTVVANVVLKKGAGDSTVATASNAIYRDGRNMPSIAIEATRHFSGGRSFSGAASASRYVELAEGNGPLIRRDAAGNALQRTSIASSADGLTSYGYGVFNTPLWSGVLAVNGSLSRTDFTYRETDTAPSGTSHLDQYLGGPSGGQLQGELGAHFNRMFGSEWESESILLIDLKGQSYKSLLTAAGSDQLFSEHEHSGETLARSSLRYQATPAITAQFGLEGAYNWLHTTNAFFFGSFPIQLPNARATVSEVREQASAQVTWTAAKWLQIEGAINAEHSMIASKADSHQHKILTYPKPRLLMTLSPDANNQIRLRLEHEVGQLNFSDFVASSSLDTGRVNAGNTNIVPQQDWVFALTYERHFWGDGDLSLTYKHLIISDAIDRVPIRSPSGGTFDAPGNIGAGVENVAVVDFTAPLSRIGLEHAQLKATGTFQWSKVTDPTTGTKRSMSGVNPAEYSLSFRQDLPQWRADWGFNLATPCFTSSTTKGCAQSQYRFDEIDSYHAEPALSLFAEYQPWNGTLFRLEAGNVLEQHYRRAVSSYGGPRDTAPLSYTDTRNLRSSASVLFSVRQTF